MMSNNKLVARRATLKVDKIGETLEALDALSGKAVGDEL